MVLLSRLLPSFPGSKSFEKLHATYQTLPATPFFAFPAGDSALLSHNAAFGGAWLPRLHIADTSAPLYADSLFSRRDPTFVFEFDASLFAFANDTPPFAFALLLPR